MKGIGTLHLFTDYLIVEKIVKIYKNALLQ